MQISAPALAHIEQQVLIVPRRRLEGLTVSQGSNATVWMLRSEIVGPSEAPPFLGDLRLECGQTPFQSSIRTLCAFTNRMSRLRGHAVVIPDPASIIATQRSARRPYVRSQTV